MTPIIEPDERKLPPDTFMDDALERLALIILAVASIAGLIGFWFA